MKRFYMFLVLSVMALGCAYADDGGTACDPYDVRKSTADDIACIIKKFKLIERERITLTQSVIKKFASQTELDSVRDYAGQVKLLGQFDKNGWIFEILNVISFRNIILVRMGKCQLLNVELMQIKQE